jgi:hypothetical protein
MSEKSGADARPQEHQQIVVVCLCMSLLWEQEVPGSNPDIRLSFYDEKESSGVYRLRRRFPAIGYVSGARHWPVERWSSLLEYALRGRHYTVGCGALDSPATIPLPAFARAPMKNIDVMWATLP